MDDPDKRLGEMSLGAELLDDLLRVPEGNRIIGAQWDFVTHSVRFWIEGKDMPLCPPGNIARVLGTRLTRNGDGHAVIDWEGKLAMDESPLTQREIRVRDEYVKAFRHFDMPEERIDRFLALSPDQFRKMELGKGRLTSAESAEIAERDESVKALEEQIKRLSHG